MKTIRVLILEPEEALLDSFKCYFDKQIEFDTRYTGQGQECIDLLASFVPHVLLLEPALPAGMAQRILDAVSDSDCQPCVPILVLTKFGRHSSASHPSVKEFFVKPQLLSSIAATIRRLAAESHSAEPS